VSAATRGIAEADSVGMAANAQAATPISSKRFILESFLKAASARQERNVREAAMFQPRKKSA
jgi:hypothetical protein